MSEQALSLIITVALLALMFAWPPFLNLVCPPCDRALDRLRLRKLGRDAGQKSLSAITPLERQLFKVK